MHVSWIRAAVCLLLGLVAMFVSALMAGGGHGSYLPAKLFFPYTLVLTAFSGDTITVFGLFVAGIQMPLYSVLADVGRARQSMRGWVICLALLHLMMFALTLLFIRGYPELPQ